MALGTARFAQFAKRFGAVLMVGALAACAAVNVRPAEEIVKERAQARWNAMVQGDTKAAYAYFSPGTRATMTMADFVAGIRIGFWKAVTVTKVECGAPDRCDVHTAIEYEYQGTRVKTPSREIWIREGSDWWFVRK